MNQTEFGGTLLHALARNALDHPDVIAINEKRRGIWISWTWKELYDLVICCALGLRERGFESGCALLVIGQNNCRLYVGMLAAALLDGYAVPAFPDARAQEIVHLAPTLTFSGAIVDDQEQVDKLLDVRTLGRPIKEIYYDEPRGLANYADSSLIDIKTIIASGSLINKKDSSGTSKLLESLAPSHIAVLVHSSGTTGKPKAIPLSHENLLSVAASCIEADFIKPKSNIVSYLPMGWVGDYAISVALFIAGRCILNIPESAETVGAAMCEAAPDFYLATPRAWEAMLTDIEVRIADTSRFKKFLFRQFLRNRVDSERRMLSGKAIGLTQKISNSIGDWLISRPIKDKYGLSKVTHAFVGGEAIGEDTFLFFRALGINLRQLYGQSEAGSFVTIQEAHDIHLIGVGRPLPGVEIKIDDDEIAIKSPGVFSGYLDQPEATADALRDGWLYTGDTGYIDDGQLVVIGRKSEILQTSTGEKFVPTYIENRIKYSHYIKDVALFGDKKPFISAIICIDYEAVGRWAQQNGITYVSFADLSSQTAVIKLLFDAVIRVNEILPIGQRIRKFISLHKEFDADDGEITRTGKLKRDVIATNYCEIIDALYSSESAIEIDVNVIYETGEVGSIRRTLGIWEI